MTHELQPPSAKRPSVLKTLQNIWRYEGMAGLQRGLGFVLIRESSKNSFRIGLFEPTVVLIEGQRREQPAMSSRFAAGVITGGLSSFICNPLDLMKTRMQLDPKRGVATSASAAVSQIVATDGVLGLWRRGVVANIARSAMATSLGLPVNYALKDAANRAELPIFKRVPALRDGACALAASAVVVVAINPLDLVRVRLFSQPTTTTAQVERVVKAGGTIAGSGAGTAGIVPAAVVVRYGGILDCITRVAATEGLQGFFKGTLASFLRIGPHQMLTFVLLGAMQRLIKA